jgi:hypothetical protein
MTEQPGQGCSVDSAALQIALLDDAGRQVIGAAIMCDACCSWVPFGAVLALDLLLLPARSRVSVECCCDVRCWYLLLILFCLFALSLDLLLVVDSWVLRQSSPQPSQGSQGTGLGIERAGSARMQVWR